MSLWSFDNVPKTPKQADKALDNFFEIVRRVATPLVLLSIIFTLAYAWIYISEVGIGDEWSATALRWTGIVCGIAGTVGLLLYVSLKVRDIRDAHRDSDAPKNGGEVYLGFFFVLMALACGWILTMPTAQEESGYLGMTMAQTAFWLGVGALVVTFVCVLLHIFPSFKNRLGGLISMPGKWVVRNIKKWRQ